MWRMEKLKKGDADLVRFRLFRLLGRLFGVLLNAALVGKLGLLFFDAVFSTVDVGGAEPLSGKRRMCEQRQELFCENNLKTKR